MGYKVIITGATGMVGEGVMDTCIKDPEIEEILLINRRPFGDLSPKVKEVIHPDFLNFAAVPVNFKDYDACFFCLGVSSVGISKIQYEQFTYDLTLGVARTMAAQNPDMVFCYVSGAGTDSSEKSRQHWARVKGKTENDLLKLSFKKAYMFRPGFLSTSPGLKNTKSYYKYFAWLERVLKPFFGNYMSSLEELGKGMINAMKKGYSKPVLEVKDFKLLAKA